MAFHSVAAGQQTWHIETAVESSRVGPSNSLDLAVGVDGRARLAYERVMSRNNWQIRENAYPWSSSESVHAANEEFSDVQVEFLPNGEPIFAFMHPSETPGNEVFSIYSREGRLFFGGDCSTRPSLAVDENGAIHVAYLAIECLDQPGLVRARLRYATNASGRWVQEEPVDKDFLPGSDYAPTFAIDAGPGGRVGLAWVTTDGERAIYYSRRGSRSDWRHRRLYTWDHDGRSGGGPILDGADLYGLLIHGVDLAISPTGLGHIIVNDDDSGDLIYLNSESEDPPPLPAGVRLPAGQKIAEGWSYGTIEVDSDGTPHVAFYDGSVRYGRLIGDTWATWTLESRGLARTRPALEIDAQGGIHVAYFAPDPASPTRAHIRYASWLDCDGDQLHDLVEIAAGRQQDCNGNGRPDACDGGCDESDVLDVCDEMPPGGSGIVDGSFEEQDPGSIPTEFGVWGLDDASSVALENGVRPAEGERMLKFLSTSPGGRYPACGGCDVLQLVPICPGASEQERTIVASARFNRVAGDAETDRLLGLRVRAYDGSPEDFRSRVEHFLAEQEVSIETDDDPRTWETVSVELDVPVDAAYVCVWIYASEDVVNDTAGSEFDGHYADAVSLRFGSLDDQPSTSFLRGDGNGDGSVELSDAIFSLNWLFLGGEAPGCLVAANANGDASVDIGDPTFLLNHLFLGGSAPPGPCPSCESLEAASDAHLGCRQPVCN